MDVHGVDIEFMRHQLGQVLGCDQAGQLSSGKYHSALAKTIIPANLPRVLRADRFALQRDAFMCISRYVLSGIFHVTRARATTKGMEKKRDRTSVYKITIEIR